MVDRHLAAAKLAELDDRVARVRTRCPATLDELRADRDALELVSFNLMLAVQSCSDIASHLIADEGWRAATNLAGLDAGEQVIAFGRYSAASAASGRGTGSIKHSASTSST